MGWREKLANGERRAALDVRELLHLGGRFDTIRARVETADGCGGRRGLPTRADAATERVLGAARRSSRECAVTHICVVWHHSFADEPVLMFSEVDDQRFELRKVEIFRDGTRGWAGYGAEAGGTRLGMMPVPSLEDIGRDPKFVPKEIDAGEFEAEWRRSTQ